MKLSELQSDKRILVIGASGTGKTHLVGTLTQLIPTLIITADSNGLDTLRAMGIDTEIILLQDWGQIWSYFGEIARLSSQYAAVAIDDFGAVQDSSIDRIELTPRHPDEERKRDKDKRAFQAQVKEQIMLGNRRLQIQQWGGLFLALDSFLSEILKLPYRVKLVTCLETVKQSPRDEVDHIYPAISGQIAYILPAKFSLVLETFFTKHKESHYYCVTCRSHERIETKSRFGEGWTMTNPTMTKILARINSKESETQIEKEIGVNL